MKNSILRDAAVLFVITLAAGLCLGLVYQITKEPIARAQARAKQEAYEKVFPNAGFTEADELEKMARAAGNVGKGIEIAEIMEAFDEDGALLGYVMTVLSKEGYGGELRFSLGLKKDGTLTGFEVLSMSETPGLGAKCTEEVFKKQFEGIRADQIVYTKTGKTADNEIDALSGATITTKAVTNAVNKALAFARESGLTAAD